MTVGTTWIGPGFETQPARVAYVSAPLVVSLLGAVAERIGDRKNGTVPRKGACEVVEAHVNRVMLGLTSTSTNWLKVADAPAPRPTG